MVEDPVVGFLESSSSRLVDGHLDVVWIAHCEIVEAVITALSVQLESKTAYLLCTDALFPEP